MRVLLGLQIWLKAEEPEETRKEPTNKLINKQLQMVNREYDKKNGVCVCVGGVHIG